VSSSRHNLSLREIARQVGYSPAGLYEYFDSKKAIMQALSDEGDSLLNERLAQVPADLPPDGLEKTWCCLAATAQDLARFGRLYAHQGNWNGRQLLSANWVTDSTRLNAVPEGDWPDGFYQIGLWNYGYQWWLVSPVRPSERYSITISISPRWKTFGWSCRY
jgi:AcrR family transcriptional regulator